MIGQERLGFDKVRFDKVRFESKGQNSRKWKLTKQPSYPEKIVANKYQKIVDIQQTQKISRHSTNMEKKSETNLTQDMLSEHTGGPCKCLAE